MTSSIAGIDPHQDTFTVGIVDYHGIEIAASTFENNAAGYTEAIDELTTHGVQLVGVEASAKWGAHVAIALVASGFDAREIPASRSAAQRRSRRLDKTDVIDAICCARALQAEPTLGPVQTLEVYDPLVAKIEAVLQHRQALVASRTLMLNHIGDQIAKLPTEVRDQLTATGKIESRLRRLEHIEIPAVVTMSGQYRLSWLQDFVDRDRSARREIRQLERAIDELLDEHGTTLRDEDGIGPINAATLLCEVGDPFRFSRESKFASVVWDRRDCDVFRRRQRTTGPASARLPREPNYQLRALHRVCHPGTRSARSRRISRPETGRRQNPTRSPTIPQTTSRQPCHTPNVARRKSPTPQNRNRRLTVIMGCRPAASGPVAAGLTQGMPCRDES